MRLSVFGLGILIIYVFLFVILPILENFPYPFKSIYCIHETCDISNWFASLLTVIITAFAVYVSFHLGKKPSCKIFYRLCEKHIRMVSGDGYL